MKRSYGSKVRTRDDKRAQLVQLLVFRPSLDDVTPASLVRISGLPEPECARALEDARKRRAA